MQSPLGRYANFGAFIASLFVVATNVLLHFLVSLGIAQTTDQLLDDLTILAFGILMGQIGAHTEAVQVAAAKINGMEAKVNELAHATPGVAPLEHQ